MVGGNVEWRYGLSLSGYVRSDVAATENAFCAYENKT